VVTTIDGVANVAQQLWLELPNLADTVSGRRLATLKTASRKSGASPDTKGFKYPRARTSWLVRAGMAATKHKCTQDPIRKCLFQTSLLGQTFKRPAVCANPVGKHHISGLALHFHTHMILYTFQGNGYRLSRPDTGLSARLSSPKGIWFCPAKDLWRFSP
jgi:hypothetical protein